MTLARRLGLIADIDFSKPDEQATAESTTAVDRTSDSLNEQGTDVAESMTEAAATATEAAGTDAAGEHPAEATSPTAGDPPAMDTLTPKSRQSVTRSRTYALVRRGRRFVMSSWLYGWLTAEPEPEVIVIDLRETRIVGAVLGVIDRVVTRLTHDLLPALPSATATRVSYWLRNRAAARPLRVVSIGVALLTNLGLLVVLAGESDPLQPVTLLLLALLLAAARGFRSTTSWAEITNTPWYQRITSALAAAFEPPEPPHSAGDQSVTSTTDATDATQANGAESGSDSLDSSGDGKSNTTASDSTTEEQDLDTADETDSDDSVPSSADHFSTGGSTADQSKFADDPTSTTDGSDQSAEEGREEPN